MKYLYLILRLFFCAHKYNKHLQKLSMHTEGYDMPTGFEYVKECCKCGKVRAFKV